MGRAPCCDKAKVKRGAWSPEEDASLITYLQKHGTGGNWISLPHKAGLNRCGKSCRLRWLNYLRPDIKHGGFSEEEDNIIYNLYSTIGSRWSFIASQLPGRTDNDVKNYWNTKLKKKLVWSSPPKKSTNTQDDHAINLAQSSSASLIPEIEISNINIIQGNYGNNSSACIDIVDANSKQQLLHLCDMHAIESKLEPTTATTQTQFGCSNDDHKELISRSTSTTSTNISSSVSQRASNLSTSCTTSQGLELETNDLGSCNWRYGTGSTCSVINNEDGIDNMVDYLGFDSSITTHHHLLLNGFGFGF